MIGCLPTQALAFLAVFVYATHETHVTQAIAFEWKPGLIVGQDCGFRTIVPPASAATAFSSCCFHVAWLASNESAGFSLTDCISMITMLLDYGSM